MVFSGTDLKDYYHCFRVSRARSLRNALALPLTPRRASSLSCFQAQHWQHPCLTSLAMGDTQAVELGQKARAFTPFELLTVHGRIVIDDVLLAEQVPLALKENKSVEIYESVARLNQLCESYLQVGLISHPKKTRPELSAGGCCLTG